MQNEDENGYLKLCELAKELIAAKPDRIRAEGLESFCEICENAKERLLRAKPQVGRGRLAVDLGLKANDIREHPEKYRETSPKDFGKGHGHSTETGKVHPEPEPSDRFPDAAERATAIPVQTTEPPYDEDDLPW